MNITKVGPNIVKERAILLASSNISKSQVLFDCNLMFAQCSPDLDESLLRISSDGHSYNEIVSYLHTFASMKAEIVYSDYKKYKAGLPVHNFNTKRHTPTYRSDVPLSILVASHSVYYERGMVYGRARSAIEAREMLQAIRGMGGEFITAYHYIDMVTGLSKSDLATTAVRIQNVPDYIIENYINTGEVYQSPAGLTNRRGSFLISNVMGDLHNIYGLSLVSLQDAMREFGTNIYEYWKV